MVLMVDISNPLGRNKETNLYPTMMQWILTTHCDDVDPTAFQIPVQAKAIQTSVPWNPLGFPSLLLEILTYPLCLLGTFYWGGAKTFIWHLPISPRKLWNPKFAQVLTKRPWTSIYKKSSKTFEYTYRWWSIHIYVYIYIDIHSYDNFLNAFRICRMKLEKHLPPIMVIGGIASFISQPSSASRWASSRTWNTNDGVIQSSWFWNIKGYKLDWVSMMTMTTMMMMMIIIMIMMATITYCFSSQLRCTAFVGLHT